MTKVHVYKARTFRNMATEYSYDPTCLEWAVLKFDDYVKKGARTLQPKTRSTIDIPDADGGGSSYAPMGVRLYAEDYKKFGFTNGCPGSMWMNDPTSAGRNHSLKCRARMEEVMMKDDDDKLRWGRAKARLDQWTIEQGEKEAGDGTGVGVVGDGTDVGVNDGAGVECPQADPDFEPNHDADSAEPKTAEVETTEKTMARGEDDMEEDGGGNPNMPDQPGEPTTSADGPHQHAEARVQTPQRPRAQKRRANDEDDQIQTVMKYLRSGKTMPSPDVMGIGAVKFANEYEEDGNGQFRKSFSSLTIMNEDPDQEDMNCDVEVAVRSRRY